MNKISKTIKQNIRKRLFELAEEEGITLLLAVETGPRGIDTELSNSGYTVRFIYIRQKEEYLKINPPTDSLQLPLEDAIEYTGWDLRKALQNVVSSYPPVFQWLKKGEFYYYKEDFPNRFLEIAVQYYSLKKAATYFLATAKTAYIKIADWEEARIRHTLTTLYALLSALWTIEQSDVVPYSLESLIGIIQDSSIQDQVQHILEKKAEYTERGYASIDITVKQYIEDTFSLCKNKAQQLSDKKIETAALDAFFLKELERIS